MRWVLRFLATAENSPELSFAAEERRHPIRRSVITALARSSPLAAAVVPELTAALLDKDPAVGIGAIYALDSVWPPPKPAVPALMRALRTQTSLFAERPRALVEINGEPSPPDGSRRRWSVNH